MEGENNPARTHTRTITDGLGVGLSRVAVVQNRAVGARRTDARVAKEPRAAVVVAPVPEEGFELVLSLPHARVLHDGE